MENNIYIITRFKINPFEDESVTGFPVGFYLKQDKAIEKVKENCCDLNEAGYYPFITIEEFPEGIHRESWNTLLFKYDRDTGNYKKIDFTNKIEITNLAMG